MMKQLCKEYLNKTASISSMPRLGLNIFDLPEKVLQFGTGVLLRGLVDFIIDVANKRGDFNGRVVMVKSTAIGHTTDFVEQDCLYTLCVKGIQNAKIVEDNYVISSISRVLSATDEWNEILTCASNPELQIIISNTTEIGLTFEPDDIDLSPPASFTGKLLAFLNARFKYCKGNIDGGFVIIPTELLPDNGDLVRYNLLKLATHNHMDPIFINWIKQANSFCNSLVDRIVPGKMPLEEHIKVEATLGYSDKLMITCEPYYLWAIESKEEKIRSLLSFANNNTQVIVADNINKFRELKLRFLNGAHTFSCGLAYLAGFTTVKEAMQNLNFNTYISELMFKEIIPAITSPTITIEHAESFANSVLDRFNNVFIDHKWLNISMQFSAKMSTRNSKVIKQYISLFNDVPIKMALGMAAHILFNRAELALDGNYYGKLHGRSYIVNDNNVALYSTAWKETELKSVVKKILGDQKIWPSDTSFPPIFIDAVVNWLRILMEKGADTAMLISSKK